MGITPTQSVLLSIILDGTDVGVSQKELCTYLGCNGIFIISLRDDINSLAERDIVSIERRNGCWTFVITEHATISISENATYAKPEEDENSTSQDDDDDFDFDDDDDNRRPHTTLPKSYTDIEEKKLFYNEEAQPQIDTLFDLLKGNNLQKVQSRLAKHKMRSGICCLLYGPPGTGKTESVLQMAKKSKRDIVIVNLSELRSQWVGESEKLCQKLWDDYDNCVATSDRTPILLLNECDGILTKRLKGAMHSIDKGENAIANIFLENMEKQRGIVICTTNFAGNLDSAFERRFLYKVHLDQPSPMVRQSIWQAMLPTLSDGEAASIAKEFALSGGQIENVTRKMFIDNVLQNKKVTLNAARKFCEQEISKNANRCVIGFKK